jgi:TonB family protein
MAAYATQALRVDPAVPSEATRRTLLEPLPETPPAAPVEATPKGAAPSRPILIGVGAGVLAVLLIGAGWWLGGSRRPATAAAVPETTAAPAPPPPLPTVEMKPATSPKRETVRKPAVDPASTPSARHEERVAAAERRTMAAGRTEPREEVAKAPPLPDSPPGRGRMITGGPGVENAEVTALGTLVYPERARGTGRKPTVKVAVLVDENGNVAEVRVKEGDPSGLGFNEAARDAARRTRFLPATQDGVPGKAWTDLNFEFVDPGKPSSPQPSSPDPAPPRNSQALIEGCRDVPSPSTTTCAGHGDGGTSPPER